MDRNGVGPRLVREELSAAALFAEQNPKKGSGWKSQKGSNVEFKYLMSVN